MKVIILCGATATGKSQLAMRLAGALGCDIINFDSLQFYKDFNIGTAKPSEADLASIPHHLVGTVDPKIAFTAGDFRREALKILDRLSQNKSYVLLVGGTGFYLQALLRGMFEAPPSDPAIKEELMGRLESEGSRALHAELGTLDAETAASIMPTDAYRILRAMEIIISTGKKLSTIRSEFKPEPFPYEIIKLGLRRSRGNLREAVQMRTRQMIEQGLIEEVMGLLKKYGAHLRLFKSVGYKETCEFLLGGKTKEWPISKLEEQIITSTMQLAKRQSTWFKRDPEIQWMDPDLEDVFQKALSFIDKDR